MYMYNLAVARNDKDFLYDSRDLSMSDYADDSKTPWIEGQPYETVAITAPDGLTLVGYYLPASCPCAPTVILAHGYSSRGLHMSAFAEFYHEELGFNVLMPDARGHGASDGHYVGFGWHERLDYLAWIDWLEGRVGADSRIVLHGVSMGGATVMMTSGEELPPRVAAVIEDCGYTSAYEELAWQLKRMYRLGPWPVLRNTSRLTLRRAGYSFEEASAIAQVAKSRTPTLFIHGDNDAFVPFDMVHRLYDACSAPKELYVVEGAGHGLAFSHAEDEYKARVVAFLDAWL